ncbi:hypothetical protein BDZ89DRAFT_1137295 [Hymenopellis radicata]|nr:hypothetical protein BDZ89DRAFT_1137295 [Hymenopellis radicata]
MSLHRRSFLELMDTVATWKRAVPDIEGDSAALTLSFGWTVSLIVCAAVVVANALPTRLKHDGHVDVTAPLWLAFTAAIFLPTVYRNEHDFFALRVLGLHILLCLARHRVGRRGLAFNLDDMDQPAVDSTSGLRPWMTLPASHRIADGGVFDPWVFMEFCPINTRSCMAYASLTCRTDDYKMNQWVDPVQVDDCFGPTPRLNDFSIAAASFIVGLRHLGLHLGVSDNNTSPSEPRLCLD